ncbi:MAG: VWA domain-containing protein [Sinimarinibacterium sp.]|jgi:hypothetical protein
MTELLPVARGRQTGEGHRHACLASAIAGRNVAVHLHDDRKQVGYADWQCIHVPVSCAEIDCKHLVVAQALLLRSGGLQRGLLLKMVGRPGVAQRYMQAEIVRAAARHHWVVPRAFSEHPWVADFPVTSDPAASYALATSDKRLAIPPAFVGVLRVSHFLGSAMPADARALATPVRGELDLSATQQVSTLDEEDAEESLFMRLLSNPLMKGQGGMLQSLMKQMLGAGVAGKPSNDEGGAGGEMPISRAIRAAKKGLLARLMSVRGVPPLEHDGVEPGTNSYAEWDVYKNRYRPDWAVVEEVDPWAETPNAELVEALRAPSQALVRQLSGIGLSYELHRNEEDGIELIIDRVVDYAIDVRTRTTPSLRLYRASRRTKRDLAVMILLDVSGSTAESGTDGGSIHRQQSVIAYQLASVFERLGDQVALFGYHSWGRNLVRFLRLKSFQDRFDNSLAERLKLIDPVGYTRTGAALRHAARKLRDETRLPHRLLIVISDGFAYDQDYEGAYAEADTRKALEKIRASGTGCLCLSIGSDQDEQQLKAVFGAATTLSVRNQNEFLANVRKVTMRALIEATSRTQKASSASKRSLKVA